MLVAVLAVLAIAACGVPEDDSPQELSADEVPFGLLTTPATTTTNPDDLSPSREANLWFVNADEQVEPIPREVDDHSPETVVRTLVETTSEEYPTGFNSAIPPGTMVIDTALEDGVLTVDLSSEFNTVVGGRSIVGVAQIVYTATEVIGVDAVRFQVDGEDVAVNDESGAQQTDPVTRTDYAGLNAG